jgi:hypothetical protein
MDNAKASVPFRSEQLRDWLARILHEAAVTQYAVRCPSGLGLAPAKAAAASGITEPRVGSVSGQAQPLCLASTNPTFKLSLSAILNCASEKVQDR